jgi:XTP/dITP diphosphohydrolase
MAAARLLVVGTHNRKKLRELAELLDSPEFALRTLADFPQALNVAETGHTFAENATLKAISQARHLGHWVLAEDSGLVVDALGGAPGIHSARFSGAGATDASNNRLLLERLQNVPPPRRTAHYVCHVALSDATGTVRAANEAVCRGRIRLEPAGTAGFGYDPLFEIVEYHRTFGELGENIKSVISHRGRALRAILPALRQLLW